MYSIKLYKEYLNFSSAHFMIFNDGSREPLHGHNYRVKAQLKSRHLVEDMVMDFLDIKPMLKKICDELDHKLLLPCENPFLKIETKGPSTRLTVLNKENESFEIPTKDVLILPIPNTSVEHFGIHLAHTLKDRLKQETKLCFTHVAIDIEESKGQSAFFELAL